MLIQMPCRCRAATDPVPTQQPDGDAHRLAVLDRLYSGDASQRHLETLHLLDPAVSVPTALGALLLACVGRTSADVDC